MFSSLINLPSSRYETISKTTIEDLNLTGLFEALFALSEGDDHALYRLCQDEETLLYRQSIIKDFLRLPGLLEELEQQLKAFGRFRFRFDQKTKGVQSLYYLIELLLVVEASVDCLYGLQQILSYYDIQSEGLMALKKSVEEMMHQPTFKKMEEDRKSIRYILKQINSVEVAINMTTGMRPYGAQVTKVNTYSYRYPKAFRQVADALEQTHTYLGHQTKHYVPVFPVEQISLDLLEEIEFALKEHKETIKKFIDLYNKIESAPFLKLHEEITFYSGGVTFFGNLQKKKLPCCYPEFVMEGDLVLKAEGAVNIALLEHWLNTDMANELVANDCQINQGHIILLTGPNSGGKTTFTQMLGQLKVLGQIGFPVPAQSVKMTISDKVVTHFPMIEQMSVDYGRFGRACHDFRDAFALMTDKSLLLMNESFAGTSHLESLEIASQVLSALSKKKFTVLYNTHLHELFDHCKELTPIKSWTAGAADEGNAFTIHEGHPKGYSRGLEVARENGVSYEQLVQNIGGDLNER